MPWDESHTTWTGGQYERPLSPEDLAALEWTRRPSRRSGDIPAIGQGTLWHEACGQLRRERWAADAGRFTSGQAARRNGEQAYLRKL